jgi:hypothetical protein
MKENPSLDDQIKFLEDFREIRNGYIQKILALCEMHEALGNLDAAGAAQCEYDRLIRNDDRLLDQIDELHERKVLVQDRSRKNDDGDCSNAGA